MTITVDLWMIIVTLVLLMARSAWRSYLRVTRDIPSHTERTVLWPMLADSREWNENELRKATQRRGPCTGHLVTAEVRGWVTSRWDDETSKKHRGRLYRVNPEHREDVLEWLTKPMPSIISPGKKRAKR